MVDAAARAWMADANCLGLDASLFFPDQGHVPAEARTVCGECEVRVTCLRYALDHGEHWGVWGGTSGRERKAIRKGRLPMPRAA